ncbi:MAG TPA: glycosyltransferase [Thermoguttaceae bacterium]|nr:glycosyltransferase [Thermoguttaceae bacterium]
MTIRQIALVFDDTIRPETTGTYCHRALGELAEVRHYLPNELPLIPRQGFDLYLNVDDGLRYRFPSDLRPSAWWAIDTHMDFRWYRKKAPDFDLVFAAQRVGARQLCDEGIADAQWLPLACDPDVHAKHDVPKEFDVCFVGNVSPGRRAELIALIRHRFSNVFVGQRYFDDMAKVYSASRIVFNRSVNNDLNMRVFEALATGSLLVTDELDGNGQDELFRDGVHLASYREPEELLDKIAFHLRHDDVRERIAAAGREEALARHTYRHRMQDMLGAIARRVPRAEPRRRSLSDGGPASSERQPSRTAVARPAGAPTQPVGGSGPVNGPQLDLTYFSCARPELASLIPRSARRVLDVGCGTGRLGELLKKKQSVDVVGIELVEAAAKQARDRLDRVIVGDVETLDPAFPAQSFDCVVCADVLEHLRDPAQVLTQARAWLKPGGCLVASIPNVRHHSVVTSLLDGNWTYEAAGLLDATHLRFFTRREIERLFQTSGYEITRIGIVPGPGYEEWKRRGRPGGVRLGRLALCGLPEEEAEEFFVYQYLVAAAPAQPIPRDTHGASALPRPSPEDPARAQLSGAEEGESRPSPGVTQSVCRRADSPGRLQCAPAGNAPSIAAAPSDAGGDGVLRMIRPSSRRILHIGCGNGGFGQAIQKRQLAEVVGIERDEAAGASARARLTQVILGDVEHLASDLIPGPFDCIVCNILAELKDPWGMLRRARAWLRRDGQLVARVPNLRHHRVIADVLDGRWAANGMAAFQPGNVRYFTRLEIEKMLFRAGFGVSSWRVVPGPGYEEWERQGSPAEVKLGGLQITGVRPEDVEDFYVEGHVVAASPVPQADHGLTSIVILTRNQLPYTRTCLDSIRQRTDEPYELIVVDNGSTDGTADYLRAQSDVKLITNANNRGFPAGCNQGIRAATGDQILLLNNDVIVTTGWLRRLLRALHADVQIGLVGPCTNNVSGMQQVAVSYTDLASLDGFAWQWGKAHDQVVEETDRLVGFCLLFRRTLVDEIGLLDERFGLGNFEDDDYCRRARQAGYRAVIGKDAFIHHFGSVTHRSEEVDQAALLARNEQLYRSKWRDRDGNRNQHEPPASPPTPKEGARLTIRVDDRGGLLLAESRIVLSACLIVRDNSETIEACLKSIKPWVDEMVVVDTGSNDGTPELARRCGARLYHFPWCDDFSAARNESFKHARGEWIFWMDSDDTIDAENGRKLRELAFSTSDPSVLGYVAQVHCPEIGEDGGTNVTVVDHVKVVRNRADLRFEGRIHEQILPSVRRAGGDVRFTDIFVVHSNADHSPTGRRSKLVRDFRLLQLDLEDRPNHPFVLFNLGMTHADAGQHEQAVQSLEASIRLSHPTESHVRKAYALLVGSYTQLGRYDEAWRACQDGRRRYPEDLELLFREGVLHQHFGRPAEAEQAYLRILEKRERRHFSSIDCGIKGFKTRHNLALVYEDLNDLAKAEEQWRKTVEQEPNHRPGWQGLGEVLLRQGKLHVAEEQVGRLQSDPSLPDALRVEGAILKARIAARRGDTRKAKQLSQDVVDRWPDDIDAQRCRCRFLFEHGESIDAEQALRELLRHAPDDAASHHNLGLIYLRTGQYELAVGTLRESARLRPDHAETYLHLGDALEGAGQLDEAKAVRCKAACRRTSATARPQGGEADVPVPIVGRETVESRARRVGVVPTKPGYSTTRLIGKLESARAEVGDQPWPRRDLSSGMKEAKVRKCE